MTNRKAKPIRIYEFDQTSFNNNGICTLFPKSAVITRDLNEYKYYLDLTHPIDETGKWKEITQDRIIVANEQPFRIKFVQKTSREIVTYCEQIFFDLNNNFIEDTNIKGKNGNTALNQILSNTNYAHPFSGTSNIQITNNSRLVRKNVLSAIIGDNENSFVNRWGGELDIDGFTFKINTRIGRNNGYKVEYSKNMTGINAKFDMRNVVTKIRPVGFDGIKLEELFVDSPFINSYAMPIIREYKYEDVKWKGSPNYQAPLNGEDDGAYETLAEAQAELRRRALAEFSENEVDLPTVNYNVNFVELSNTDEYANYQALSSINIGDDVVIRHKILDINIPARCTAYKYNCLTCNFDEITLGHYNQNFFADVRSAMNDVNSVKSTIQELPRQLNDILQQSKEYVTDFINGGFGGYVYYTPNAIYILDNPDVNVAKNVAVFNMNGLGFSNDGINGTFETAITRDGHIVADFIDTGILTADIIKTGILESKNGKSWLDMSTGEFNFGDKVKYENGKFEIIVESSDGGNTSLGNELNNMNNKIDSITNAPTLELTGEQAFLYENNFTGTPTPPSIKISAKVENVVNPTYQWYFRRSGETSWTPIANNNYNYYNVFHDNSTIFNNPNVKNVTFKCVVGNVYDEFTIVKVSSGANGAIGNDGISITEIQEQYYLSTSQQSLVGGTWQTTAPTWVKGKYIWTRTKFTYSNNSVTTTSPICVTGKDGDNGVEGTSVSNVDVFYYQSTSATSLQGGSWQTTAPTWTNGKYVWSKTITYLDNGTQIESNPICITGERGQNGIDGINGTNGKDGISTYFFIRYSEFSDGSNMTSTPTTKTKYMGTATTTTNVAPTTPSSYVWTLVKGADGKDGEQGIAGANGSSSYLHIKYSNDGRTFTANNGEELGSWIGTYVDTNPMDSSVFSDYNWVRFVGEDGADAYTVLLSNENHTFPSTYEGNIENAITTTTVAIAYKGKTSITPTIGTLPTVTGLSLSKSGNTVTIVANKGTSLANTGTFKIPVIVDGITFEKTFSWSKSKNGLSGADGEDGYTVFLTNENFTFVADDTGNVTKAQTTTTNILAYKGSNSLAFTIGTLPTVNGLTLSKTTDTITIKANTGTSLADVGSFDIIINADGKSFAKKFSWSKTRTGASGSNAEYVTVTGEQVFKYTNNFSGTPTPSSIKLTATKFNTTVTGKWQFKNASGTWTDCTLGGNTITDLTLNLSPTSYLLSTEKQMSVRYIVGSLYDEISIVKVSDGAKGDTGATGSSGIGISSITEYYAVSSSNTTAPTSWSTTVPTMTATNKYLWNYETITYSNNTTTNTSKRVIGVYGDKGNTGATGSTGATGNGISKITNYYLATSSSSGITTSTSGWTTTVQVVSASKKYLWNYEVVTYTNGSTSTTTPCIIGTYGDKGDKGDNGDGAKNVTLTASSQVFKSTDGGQNFTPNSITIKPTYQNVTHSKWQHSLDGGKTWVDTGTNTNGVTIDSNGFTISNSSTVFTDKITSIVVKDVTNNSSIYDTITITRLYDVTDIEIGGTNLAIGTNQGSSRWSWSLQEGDKTVSSEVIDGVNCVKLVKGNTTPHSGWNYVSYNKFARDKITPNTTYTVSFEIKSNKTFDVSSIDLKYGNSSDTLIASSKAMAKSVKANSDWTKIIFELKTKDVLPTTTGQVIYITGISATNGNIHYIRNLQLEKGNKATDWSPAVEDLENAYTIVLTNEAQVIPTNNSRVPTSSTTYYTDIVVYQGTTQRTDYTIGTINGANGITVSKTSSRVNFAVSTGTSLTADGGNFTIPITIDGKTFNKTFSWSCSKQGSTGNTGNGINTITEYYAISSSNTTAPTSWSTTVPNMTSTNKYLWNYEVIKYTDNTTKETAKRVIGAYGDKGATGSTGATGATGNGISKITNYYLASSSSSGITTSTSGWTTSVQSVSSSKKYLWNYEVITYTNGSTSATTPCIIGAYGDTGDGAKTVSLTSSSQVFKSTDGGLTFTPDNIVITPNYQNVSYSKWQYSTNGGSSWTDVSSSTNGVTYSSTSLTLSKTSTLFTNKVTSIIFKIVTNNNSITDTITIVKLYDVTDLKIGATNYLRQSSNYSSPYWGNKGATITDEYYMGSKVYKVNAQWGAMTYKKNKELELEPEAEYILSAYIKKDSGITYDSGANMSWYGLSVNTTVVALDNLTTSWKQYSVKRKGKEITVDGDGAGIRIEPNKSVTGGYIYVAGIQIEKGNKATDWKPNTNDLENAYTIVLTNEAQVIPTNSNRVPTSNATYTTDIQVYQGTTQRTDYTIGTINSANGITVSKTSSRVSFAVSTGTAITADGGNFTIPITIDNKTFNKTFSWSCSKQGTTGNTGATGASGADAYTVILTNESHTFATQNNGNVSSAISTTTQVLAYKGASSITPTIGTLPTVNGLTLSKSGTTITIQANTGTSLADSGSFNIPVTVDGKSFTKTFSWSKSKQGATGATGATGASGTNAKSVDIVASTQVFKSTDGGKTFLPNSIVLTAVLQNVTYNGWQCSTDGGKTWSGLSNSTTGWSVSNGVLTINNNFGLFTSTNTTVVFRVNTNDSKIYDTITLVKLYDVTDIDVGGRNYIKNGKGDMKAGFFKNFNDVTGAYGELTLTSQKTYSNISIADGFVLKCRDYEVGRKMVFSYDIMYTKWDFPSGTNRSEFWIGQRYTNSPTSTDGQWQNVTKHNLPVVGEDGCKLNEWYHVSKIITIPKQAEATIGTSSSIQFYNSNADVSASFTARFKNVKLEYGNVETDWTPSPEDIDYDINTAINPLIKTDEQLTKRLDNAFSDDVITAYEKIQIASDLKEIDAQYDDVTKTVKSYNDSSITGIYNEYKVAYNNLHTVLDPCLKSMDTDTKLSNSVVKDAFLLYGTYYSHLRSAIDDYIKNSFDITKSSITSLSNSVDIAISKSSSNEQNLNTIAKHMKFSDEGWLELFATTNGNEGRFKTKITDTKLSFTDNNQEVAYMSNQKLYINYAQINNDLQIGSIVATKSDKGGIVFKWQ